jgi:hypothetical protein
MKPLDALHLQLRLEGKEVIHGDSLRQVEVVPDEEMPLMLIAQLADESMVAYFDEMLEPELQEILKEQIACIRFPDIDPLLTLLQGSAIPFDIGHYKTCTFPASYTFIEDHSANCYNRQDARVKAFGFFGFAENVFAIEMDGKLISACVSTRENSFCGEAWIYTDEDHRHQGFAQKAVSAWAASLLSAGKVPFYSYKITNMASASLAKRLGLQPLFEEIVLTRLAN